METSGAFLFVFYFLPQISIYIYNPRSRVINVEETKVWEYYLDFLLINPFGQEFLRFCFLNAYFNSSSDSALLCFSAPFIA